MGLCLSPFAVRLKLTPHCKPPLLQQINLLVPQHPGRGAELKPLILLPMQVSEPHAKHPSLGGTDVEGGCKGCIMSSAGGPQPRWQELDSEQQQPRQPINQIPHHPGVGKMSPRGG